jgi:hypothetical protein
MAMEALLHATSQFMLMTHRQSILVTFVQHRLDRCSLLIFDSPLLAVEAERGFSNQVATQGL